MTYVVSDLHGCYDKFVRLLEKIDLKDEDRLYVLGDVVDRGPDSIRLITLLAEKKNIVTLMGNHDYTALLMMKIYGMKEWGRGLPLRGKPAANDVFEAWLSDGGETTWKAFMQLDDAELGVVYRFLEGLPAFAEIEVNGQSYHLSHTVAEAEQMRDTDHCLFSDYLFGEPEYDTVYYPDKILVTGHTPTGLIDPSSAGRIWKKNHHIALDCGAVFGNPLGCICLETGEEYYAE